MKKSVPGAPTPPLDLVTAIFDAATDDSRRPAVVAQMTAWVGGEVGGLQVRQLAPELAMDMVSTGVDPAFGQTYAEEYFRIDPHLEHVGALGEGQSLLSRELLSDRHYRHSRFHAEWVRPQGLHDLQGAVILRDDEHLVTFATYAPARSRFDLATRARLDVLLPHLQRSLRVSSRMRELEATRAVLGAAQGARAVGSLRVDGDLRVVSMAPATESWLGENALPLRRKGMRVVGVGVSDQRLRALVAAALRGECPAPLVVGDGSATSIDLVIVAGPAPTGRESVVDLVFWPKRGAPDETGPLAELPPYLHAVARGLAGGFGDKEIAEQLGIPLSTVRTYAARALRRLAVRSRRELMCRWRHR